MENFWQGGIFKVFIKLAMLLLIAAFCLVAAWLLLLLIARVWAYVGLPIAVITGFLLYRVRSFQAFVSKRLRFLRGTPVSYPVPVAISTAAFMAIASLASISFVRTRDVANQAALLQNTPTPAVSQNVAVVSLPSVTPKVLEKVVMSTNTPLLVPTNLPVPTKLPTAVVSFATSESGSISGWTPEIACAFLTNFPRMTPDAYEFVSGLGSSCGTDDVKLPGSENTISYIAIGNETVVNELSLGLLIYDARTAQVTAALKVFQQYAGQIVQKATGKKLPADWNTAIIKAVDRQGSFGKYQIELRRDNATTGKGFQLIFFLSSADGELGNINNTDKSAKPTVEETVLYRPLLGNIWTGVKVYYGKISKKQYGFEIVGGGSNCANMPSGRGVKVRYENGSEEWKDRDYLISSELFFVHDDDPARSKRGYIDFDGCI